MSRLAKNPIKFDAKVEVQKKDDRIHVKGPLGELDVKIIEGIEVEIKDQEIMVKRKDDTLKNFQGLVWSLIRNAVEGVTQGFSKTLVVQGKGWKSKVSGSTIDLQIGYSHPVKFEVPKAIKATQENPGEFTLTSFDKQLLGATVAKIIQYRPVEPYKHKGIFIKGSYLRKKERKQVGV
jgi:large subunit ribosomal protein L6